MGIVIGTYRNHLPAMNSSESAECSATKSALATARKNPDHAKTNLMTCALLLSLLTKLFPD